MTTSLSVVHCHGIHMDSLGHYLAGLGLIAALSKKWPAIRGAWKDEHLVLIGEQLTQDKVKTYLLKKWKRTPYQRWWSSLQKQDTKAKSSIHLQRERNRRSLFEVRLMDAHIVGTSRNHFNPILGTGGNIGKRDVATIASHAALLIGKAPDKAEKWLEATLNGDMAVDLPDLPGASTWFVFANKSFNSGQSWYREGRISPWSVLFATEGALLLVGGVNRRLGATSRAYAVFPFVSEPSRPLAAGEVGNCKGEFWAPLWERPATISELLTVFQRGLAQLGGRPAKAPHEFAVAARAAGVDAGIVAFVRYELRQTTSSQVYEAIPRQRISVWRTQSEKETQVYGPSDADLMLQLIESGWLDRLPHEPRDAKQKGKFVGLRGPVEASIISTTQKPDDPQSWQTLLMLLATTQLRIDRNRSFRERCVPLPLLDPAWFSRAWPAPVPGELRVAQAIASIGAGTAYPVLMNIFGVKYQKNGRLVYPKARPQSAVWNFGDPLRLFTEVLRRRLVDVNPTDEVPLDATRSCSGELVNLFIVGALDIETIARWIPPLSLIDWSKAGGLSSQAYQNYSAMDGIALLHALLRPFFYPRPIWVRNELVFPADKRPHAELARHLFNLLQHGNLNAAINGAANAYRVAGHATVKPDVDLHTSAERVAAGLLIPMLSKDISEGIERWLQPARTQSNRRGKR